MPPDNTPTELAYPDAVTKIQQIHRHLETYHTLMTRAKHELQGLIDNNAASGQFMIRFGEIWNHHSAEMFSAYTGLSKNADVCLQNYDGIKAAADN